MYVQLVIAFGIYLTALIFIGVWTSRKNKASDFALGGRSTNYWVSAIALQASDSSHWLFLAFPGAVFHRGVVEVLVPLFLVVCMFLNWHFIAPRLRRMTARHKAVTLFSFFEKHFEDTSGVLRIAGALIALIFFAFFIASGPVAMGLLFQSLFHVRYEIGVVAGLATAMLYILIGGYRSVTWCNFFQGMFLLLILIFVPLYGYFWVGGWHSIAAAAQARNLALFSFPSAHVFADSLLVAIGWGLGYFGQPHLFNYFMGIKDPKNIKYAKFLGGIWQSLALIASFCLGLVSIAYFSNGIANPETSFVVMTTERFFPLIAGFILCALLAATLTTLNSQILTTGSILAQDIYKKIFHQTASPKTMLWISRAAVIIVTVFSGYIAMTSSLSLYDLVAYAWSGIGSAFAPLTIASLYWKGANKYGALAGMFAGAITVAIWPYLNIDLFPMIPGFIVSSLMLYFVSKLTAHKTSPNITAT